MINQELQNALVENYLRGLGLLKKEQVEISVYYKWVGLISGMYDIAVDLVHMLFSAKISMGNIEKSDNYGNLFEISRSLFDVVGEVNNCLLFENSRFGKIIISYASLNLKKQSALEDFRLDVERYIARKIYIQNAMTDKMIEDLKYDKDLTRKFRSKVSKKQKEIITKDVIKEKDLLKEMPATNVLYIYKGNIKCHTQNHEIIQATAILYSKQDNEIKINVEYCTECQKFFLEYSLFEEYRQIYGMIIGNFRLITKGNFDGDYDLAEESPLKLSGYSVGQKEGYSSSERHYILARIIHDGIMSKGEIIRYLSFFIKRNGVKSGNENALIKWKEDLLFAETYNISLQPKMIVSEIKKY